jgi:hypothetical protein
MHIDALRYDFMGLHCKFNDMCFKMKEKLTSLLSSSGRSGTSIGGEIVEGAWDSTGSETSKQQAGAKTFPESDTRTRLSQLYAECKTFWTRITDAIQHTFLDNLCLAFQVHIQRPPIYDF